MFPKPTAGTADVLDGLAKSSIEDNAIVAGPRLYRGIAQAFLSLVADLKKTFCCLPSVVSTDPI